MQNLEYDIFISYPHALNEQKGEDGKGWVDHFFDKLSYNFKNISGLDLKPWLDNNQLSCGDTLGKIEKEGLRNTRFLIPILSPAFINSKWCRREFIEFAKYAKHTNSLYLENSCRILPIVFYPYDDIRLKEPKEIKEFDKLKSYLKMGSSSEVLFKKFYDDSFMKRFFVPTDKEFDSLCLEFAQVLDEKLKAVENIQLEVADKSPGIYLGLTSRISLEDREMITNELKDLRKYEKHEFDILPGGSELDYSLFRQMDLKDYNKVLFEHIENSSVGMVILDERYGQNPEDSEISYLELQYNLLAEKAKKEESEFKFWVHITDEEIKDPRQMAFIEKVNEDFENFPENILRINYRSVKELGETLLSAVLAHEEKLQKAQEEGPSREHVMLLINSKDENSIRFKELDDFIFEKEIEVRKPSFNKGKGRSDDFEKYLSDALEKCRKAIIFFGANASDEWCNAVKIDILKAINLKGAGIDKKAICITDPDVDKRIRKVRSHEFSAFNCEDEEFYDKINSFLSP